MNAAKRLCQDPTFWLIGSGRISDRGVALTSRLQTFETEMVAVEENVAGFGGLNRVLIGRAEAMDSDSRAILDMDSTEIPVYGEQEQSTYNGHFESTCYHPLLLSNREGDCLAAELRPGNVHSAENWEEVLLPEIERQQKLGKEVVFQADAPIAKSEVYEALETRGVKMARLSCHRFRSNEVRLWRSVSSLTTCVTFGGVWCCRAGVSNWSLTSLQQRLVKTGGACSNTPGLTGSCWRIVVLLGDYSRAWSGGPNRWPCQ